VRIAFSACHGYTFPFTNANAATDAKSNGDTFARTSSGLKYLDAIAS
jgi:hypothetical protein